MKPFTVGQTVVIKKSTRGDLAGKKARVLAVDAFLGGFVTAKIAYSKKIFHFPYRSLKAVR